MSLLLKTTRVGINSSIRHGIEKLPFQNNLCILESSVFIYRIIKLKTVLNVYWMIRTRRNHLHFLHVRQLYQCNEHAFLVTLSLAPWVLHRNLRCSFERKQKISRKVLHFLLRNKHLISRSSEWSENCHYLASGATLMLKVNQ